MAAPPDEIESEIQVGGLAPTKSGRIKAVLEEVWRRRGSFDLSLLAEMPLDEAKGWLRSLPGVGPKTAACVLMFALGRPWSGRAQHRLIVGPLRRCRSCHTPTVAALRSWLTPGSAHGGRRKRGPLAYDQEAGPGSRVVTSWLTFYRTGPDRSRRTARREVPR